jgi:hypothetical protein
LGVRFRSRGIILAGLVGAGLGLTACAGHGHKHADARSGGERVDPNSFPVNYKADVIGLVRTSVADPSNIRDAYISEPALRKSDTENRYVVCVRFNGKGRDGRYLGVKEKMVIYFAGNPNQYIDATPDKCGGANYQPFPELEALTLGR